MIYCLTTITGGYEIERGRKVEKEKGKNRKDRKLEIGRHRERHIDRNRHTEGKRKAVREKRKWLC